MNAIAIIVNNNHFKYIIPFLNSLVHNWPNYPTILCHYDSDLSTEKLEQLKKYERLELILIKLEEHEIGLCPYFRKEGMLISYAKLKLFSEQYDEYDNILYLDVDTLVLKPLDEIIKEKEFIIFRAMYRLEFFKKSEELKNLLIEDSIFNYFNEDFKCLNTGGNSGVMVIPKKYRSHQNHKSMLYLLNRYRNYNNTWADQSIINIWMLKNNINISPGINYNFLTFYLNPSNDYWSNFETEFEKEFNDIFLVHFVLKPEVLLNQDYLKKSEISMSYSKKLYELFTHYSLNNL